MFLSFENNAAYKRIYHRKWNSEENEVYHQQIYTVCGIDNSKIPVSWSREIYELIREIQQQYPKIKILNIKEKQYELKFYFTLPRRYETSEAKKWINSQIARTKVTLILKNSYMISPAQLKKSHSRIHPLEFNELRQAFTLLSQEEIEEIQSREPQYQDNLLLEEALPKAEIEAAYAYLDDHLPQWRSNLHLQSQTPSENNKNPRLEIMFHLATKYSGFRPLSIASSEEILSLDKFSEKRTRAIFGEDISLQLSLKLYETGDREGIERLKDGQLTTRMKNLETELIQNKEKSILVENIIAFYKLKEKEEPYTKAI